MRGGKPTVDPKLGLLAALVDDENAGEQEDAGEDGEPHRHRHLSTDTMTDAHQSASPRVSLEDEAMLTYHQHAALWGLRHVHVWSACGT